MAACAALAFTNVAASGSGVMVPHFDSSCIYLTSHNCRSCVCSGRRPYCRSHPPFSRVVGFRTVAAIHTLTHAGAVCAAAAAHPAARPGQHRVPEDCRGPRAAGRWVLVGVERCRALLFRWVASVSVASLPTCKPARVLIGTCLLPYVSPVSWNPSSAGLPAVAPLLPQLAAAITRSLSAMLTAAAAGQQRIADLLAAASTPAAQRVREQQQNKGLTADLAAEGSAAATLLTLLVQLVDQAAAAAAAGGQPAAGELPTELEPAAKAAAAVAAVDFGGGVVRLPSAGVGLVEACLEASGGMGGVRCCMAANALLGCCSCCCCRRQDTDIESVLPPAYHHSNQALQNVALSDALFPMQVVGRLLYRQPALLPVLLDNNADSEGRWADYGSASQADAPQPATPSVVVPALFVGAPPCTGIPLVQLQPAAVLPPHRSPTGCWTAGSSWAALATSPRCLCRPWARWGGERCCVLLSGTVYERLGGLQLNWGHPADASRCLQHRL